MSLNQTYIICATQRSGSTLLCHLLASTGVAGTPGEYLLPTYDSKVEFNEERYLDYVSENLALYASENGVSGVKMMENNFSDMLQRLVKLENNLEKPKLGALSSCFPNVKFVFVTRRSKIRQAVSLSRAEQNDQWEKYYCTDNREGKKKWDITPFYIKSAIKRVLDREEKWKEFFRENHMEPFTVTYEELARDPKKQVKRLLDFIGVEYEQNDFHVQAKLKKQSNFYTEILILYYQFYFFMKSILPKTLWKGLKYFKNSGYLSLK